MNSRRLLLVAFHYGPRCATGGFRWNAMVQHLEALGWAFDVITKERYWNAGGRRDASAGISPRARVYPVAAPTWTIGLVRWASTAKRFVTRRGGPQQHQTVPEVRTPSTESFPYPMATRGVYGRVTSFLDGLQWTFPEMVWARRATGVARRLCRSEEYHAIIVSSPPHASHCVGLAMQREFGIPFVADFRDLWKAGTGTHDRLDSISRWLARRYEARVFCDANTVILNTDLASEAVSAMNLVGGTRAAIANGFDANGRRELPDPRAFRILLTGQWYPSSDLDAFFAACRRLRCRMDGAAGEAMRVEFIGTPQTHRGVPLDAIARFYGLDDVFAIHERVTREEAARLQQAAAVLVAFDQASRPAIPVKFYDYTQAFGTMLLLGDPESDLAAAAAKLGVSLHDQTDTRAIDAVLAGALQRWRDRDFTRIADPGEIFDRVHQSKKMHELLSAL